MSFITKKSLFVAPLILLLSCGQDKASNQQDANTGQPAAQQTESAAAHSGHSSGGATMSAQGDPSSSIPEFNFYILKSGIRMGKSDLKQGNKHVFVFFDPGCSYCQHEARDVGQHIDKFQNTSFYFISMNDPALMSTFFDTYAKELNDKPNVHMLYDRDMEFINKFHVPSQYPATYIYGSNGLLLTYWNGVKSTNDLVNAILN